MIEAKAYFHCLTDFSKCVYGTLIILSHWNIRLKIRCISGTKSRFILTMFCLKETKHSKIQKAYQNNSKSELDVSYQRLN